MTLSITLFIKLSVMKVLDILAQCSEPLSTQNGQNFMEF